MNRFLYKTKIEGDLNHADLSLVRVWQIVNAMDLPPEYKTVIAQIKSNFKDEIKKARELLKPICEKELDYIPDNPCFEEDYRDYP